MPVLMSKCCLQVFKVAKVMAPSVIYIDEVEKVKHDLCAEMLHANFLQHCLLLSFPRNLRVMSHLPAASLRAVYMINT